MKIANNMNMQKERGDNMKSSYFKMSSQDKFTLVFLLLYAVISFLFLKSQIKISGMVLFGWLMGALMFLAPIVGIINLNSEYREKNLKNENKVNL